MGTLHPTDRQPKVTAPIRYCCCCCRLPILVVIGVGPYHRDALPPPSQSLGTSAGRAERISVEMHFQDEVGE